MEFALPQQGVDTQVYDFVRAAWPTVLKQQGEFAVICQTYPNYLCTQLLSADRAVEEMDLKFTWPVLVKQGAGGRHQKLGAEDSISIEDVTRLANDQMVQFSEPIAWEVREILSAQNNPKKMFTLLTARRASIQLASIDTLEAALWGAPTSTEEAEDTPKGIPFWIQKENSLTDGSFTGGDPSGFTNGAGNLASATYTGWQNYVDNYVAWTDDDGFDALQKAMLKMNVRAPGGHAKDVPDNQGMSETKFFCNMTTYLALKKATKEQNDQCGMDLDPISGGPMFNKRKFEYIAYLDNDTQNPLYIIDMSVFKAHYLRGDYWRETGPAPVAGRHNTIGMFVDLSYQWVCTNRRKTGVIHVST
jgi:hypothetical protein